MSGRRSDDDPDFNPEDQQMIEVDEDLNTSGGGDHHDDAGDGAATAPSPGDQSGNALPSRRRHLLQTDGTRTG